MPHKYCIRTYPNQIDLLNVLTKTNGEYGNSIKGTSYQPRLSVLCFAVEVNGMYGYALFVKRHCGIKIKIEGTCEGRRCSCDVYGCQNVFGNIK